MNINFNLYTPTKLLFGCGKLNELSEQELPGKKALLLISNGKSVHTNSSFDRTVGQLDKAGVAHVVCAKIHENPSKEVVMEAANIARDNGCDFVVALGGGAVIKMARAMGMKDADKPEDFLTALYELQKACGVENLKMSDYGFNPEEFYAMAVNARETNPVLYPANPCELTDEDAAEIYRRSFR